MLSRLHGYNTVVSNSPKISGKLSACANSGYQALSFPAHREPGYEANVAQASVIATIFFLFHTQLNGTNTTYLDVCPLLEPSPSTPSGDYVQPVNVARDIELQTRNLPAPVSFNFGLAIF